MFWLWIYLEQNVLKIIVNCPKTCFGQYRQHLKVMKVVTTYIVFTYWTCVVNDFQTVTGPLTWLKNFKAFPSTCRHTPFHSFDIFAPNQKNILKKNKTKQVYEEVVCMLNKTKTRCWFWECFKCLNTFVCIFGHEKVNGFTRAIQSCTHHVTSLHMNVVDQHVSIHG
jgi:hypothetical protein